MSEAESSGASRQGKAVQPAKQAPPQKPGGRSSAFVGMVATLALLIALAAAGVIAYEYWQRQQQETSQPWLADIQSLKTRLDSLEATQEAALDKQRAGLEEALQRHQVSAQSALQEQRQRLATAQARLQRLDEKVQHLASVGREDWLLAEAEYLLRLARHRLSLGGDLESAAQLLRAAQSSLRAVGDPDIETVRAAVAADLKALEEARRFDLRALYADVGKAAEQAAALTPLAARTVEVSAENARQNAEQTEPPPLTLETLWPALKYALASTADKLQAYIRVSHRDSDYQRTVIAGGQAALFAQNLQLLFEQAQWALLAGNAELYREALARSQDWLRRYYALGESEQALLDSLEALQQRRIRPPTPPLDGSLEAVMLYIDGRQIPGSEGAAP